MASKIKQGDTVIVRSGDSKGQKGKVVRVYREANRVLVEGVNMVKKHLRTAESKAKGGEIIEVPASVHISNVALLDPKDGKATRVGFKVEDGKKVRIAKNSGSVIK